MFKGRQAYLVLLTRLRVGRIQVIEDFEGGEKQQMLVYGDTKDMSSKPDLCATITVKQRSFYSRLILLADLGFADAYISDQVQVDNLTNMMKIFILNREILDGSASLISKAVSHWAHTRLANTIANSLSNVSAHYDLGNELFTSFLDSTMMYSSAVWSKDNPDSETMYDGQMRKINMFINKARLRRDDNVLEIGTGWGGMSIEAVKQTGCRITTITLSKEQKEYADDRIAALPSAISSRITVLLCDYRHLPQMFPKHSFDKIISIEMIEAIGHDFLPLYFDVCNTMLNPVHGIMVFQCITMPELRHGAYINSVDFIQRYIFPGGHCPTVTTLTAAINTGSQNNLIVENMENIGPHYARTLRMWSDEFQKNYDKLLRPVQKYTAAHSPMWQMVTGTQEQQPFFSDEFLRKWIYYFAYCEAGFATRTLGNVQMVLTRECNPDLVREVESFAL